MRLAVFDLDGTLLEGDSGFEWPRFLADEGAFDREACEALISRMHAETLAGTLNIAEYLRLQLAPLSAWPRQQIETWRIRFVQEKIIPMIKPRARLLVAQQLRDADLVAIITGTSRYVAEPVAAELGVEHLIATESKEENERFTGSVAGVPCFREGKVARLEAWLEERGLGLEDFRESWFYSDSCNDIPLLGRVSHPVAVDPDERLRRYAAQHEWQVISMR